MRRTPLATPPTLWSTDDAAELSVSGVGRRCTAAATTVLSRAAAPPAAAGRIAGALPGRVRVPGRATDGADAPRRRRRDDAGPRDPRRQPRSQGGRRHQRARQRVLHLPPRSQDLPGALARTHTKTEFRRNFSLRLLVSNYFKFSQNMTD